MNNTTDTNQASEDELDNLIEKRIKIASTETKSGDEVVHIAWLADGIDLWNRSNGKFGHSPAKARRYIISSVTRLIRTEKLKLLAEVRERVVGEDDFVDAEILKKLYDKAYSNGYNDKGYENSYNSRDYRSAEDIAPVIANIRGGYEKRSAALAKLEGEL